MTLRMDWPLIGIRKTVGGNVKKIKLKYVK
jgi:hypothetical protein